MPSHPAEQRRKSGILGTQSGADFTTLGAASLPSRDSAIAARIRRSLKNAVRVPDDRTRMAHHARNGRHDFNIVHGSPRRGQNIRGHAIFQLRRCRSYRPRCGRAATLAPSQPVAAACRTRHSARISPPVFGAALPRPSCRTPSTAHHRSAPWRGSGCERALQAGAACSWRRDRKATIWMAIRSRYSSATPMPFRRRSVLVWDRRRDGPGSVSCHWRSPCPGRDGTAAARPQAPSAL